jgi:hypothetical protein
MVQLKAMFWSQSALILFSMCLEKVSSEAVLEIRIRSTLPDQATLYMLITGTSIHKKK